VGAGIKGSGASNQLSTTPGERVSTSTIEDDAIDKDKLRDDATGTPGINGSPSAAVNTANHIKDRIITAAKVVLASLTRAELKMTTSTFAVVSLTIGPGSSNQVLGTAFTPAIPITTAATVIGLSIGAVATGWLGVRSYIGSDTTQGVFLTNAHDSVSLVNINTTITVTWLSLT
jgi:hypothetical protein